MGTITDKLNYLAETKEEIKQAIVGRGQTIADTDTFRDYATKIANITIVKNQKKSANATSSAAVTLKPDSEYTGLSEATVTPILQTKSANCTSTSAVVLTPDSGYCGLSKATVTPVTETRTQTINSNGTTSISVNANKVGMTKVTTTVNVNPTLTPANRVNYCQEYGSGAFEIAKECVIPAKSNMIYAVTCIGAASNAGAPTISFDNRTGCTFTYISAVNTSSQINGVVGMKFYTAYYRVNNTSGAQQATYIRTTMTENRGIIVSSINY